MYLGDAYLSPFAPTIPLPPPLVVSSDWINRFSFLVAVLSTTPFGSVSLSAKINKGVSGGQEFMRRSR